MSSTYWAQRIGGSKIGFPKHTNYLPEQNGRRPSSKVAMVFKRIQAFRFDNSEGLQ